MTDLYNRTYINEVLKKNKVEQDTAVFIFDIDHLKYVNDHYGHLQGDEIIKNVAHVLKNNFRESDSVARIGGDEFMVLIPKCGEQTANMFLERLRQAFEKQNKKQTNEHLKLSISAGYAIANEQQQEYGLEALMQEADEHMYENKLIKRKLTEDEQNR
jgi:diguanylate cyclase (GGDEF)-like protein